MSNVFSFVFNALESAYLHQFNNPKQYTKVETQKLMVSLSTKILDIERERFPCVDAKSKLEIMVTFSADFQVKITKSCEIDLYPENKHRIFGWPWFATFSQKEPFKIWTRIC